MKKLIFQTYIGKKLRLYDHCTSTVRKYAERIGADYLCQTVPTLKIKPDIFATNRHPNAWEKHGGFMPIFEKENVFDHLKDYDMCCVVDADIYIRSTAPDIFKEMSDDYTVGAVYECNLPLTNQYAAKIKAYSANCWRDYMQYNWNWNNRTGGEFFNSGLMLYNSKNMLKALNGMTPKEFLQQPMLKDFIDGKGGLKWQSDQMTLNYWFKANNIDVKKLDWKYNAMFKAIVDEKVKEAHFVHFFMKAQLPENGEAIEFLMKQIGEKM
jgi:hypothetical protein